MKINANLVNNAYQNTLNLKEKVKDNNHNADIKTENTDKVSMSEAGLNSSLIAKANKTVTEEINNDFSASKIASFKAAIESGNYTVSAESVADKMLTMNWKA